ncbi:unnamed protein product [Toxocara canis]|uniref:Kindlin_2_N domain-containing protein n=1 Tax=Toxocara canis TaxID=6265 RepID=A0A183UUU0_TOXCA|nr:unnamed protein product [Toxocara canis]
MAHLVENGVINDGSWSLSVLVTDMNIQRTLFVTGQLHIGGLMLKLVDEIDLFFASVVEFKNGAELNNGTVSNPNRMQISVY